MITRTLWCLILLSTTLGAEAHAHLPLTFEANRGQLDARVDFVVRSAGYTGFLSSGDLYLHLDPAGGAMPSSGLVIALAGRADGAPLGEELTAGRSHYLLGSDPEQWVRAVPHWRRVRYRDVYPGIDVV